MGLFEKLFSKPQAASVGGKEYLQLIDGYVPVFTNWRGSIYENELVSAAIEAKARHVSKAEIIINGSAKKTLTNKLKHAPNDWQTWGQFLARTSTILDVHNTAVIVPVLDAFGDVAGIYSVVPSITKLVEYKGAPWLRFQFNNGKTAAMELSACGLLTKHQYKSDYFGEPNTALNNTMNLINVQNQGIEEAVKSAASFRFMATMGNFASDSDLKKERERFTRDNLQNGGGLLLFPNTYKDIKQINSSPFVVDSKQMELIRNNVFEYFGVNEDVLQNKAYGDAWAAFYEGAIEPFLIQFSDVVSKMLFTEREREAGNKIYITSNRMQYLSNADKLNVTEKMGDRGFMTRDEIRAIWNLPPLPDGLGNTIPVRGEYYDLIADAKENEEGVNDNGNGN